ncbi:MAG: primosomal protein N' [Firmicutes bacterium]|nr:primosomal protein N' [Bacillota bacterium]
MPNFAEIIVDISNPEVDRIFDYAVGEAEGVVPGARVMVPFGPRSIEGYVIGLKETSGLDPKKIKAVISALDPMPVISTEMFALAKFMIRSYRLTMANALRLFIPAQMRGGKIKELKKLYAEVNPEYLSLPTESFIKSSALAQLEVFEYIKAQGEVPVTELNQTFSASALRNLVGRGVIVTTERGVSRRPYEGLEATEKQFELTDEQRRAVATITQGGGELCVNSELESSNIITQSAPPPCVTQPSTFLLHGVTGSGKTEVYMAAISDALRRGKTAIMLVPEIALTPQVLKNFRLRFGENVALLHSKLSAGERFDEWRRLLTGEASVAVGPRSAVFAPLKNVGLIIIDEEHDASYISETNPRYHTAEVAEFRRAYNNCTMILGSATPSVETYFKTRTGEIKLIELPNRVNRKPLPAIETVDMCRELREGNNGMFSRRLLAELRECFKNNNQAMLFINRRGYSSYVICHACGYVAKCTQCDVSLVYHKEDNALKCHYCQARFAPLAACPQCGSPHIRQGFIGTERVAEQLIKLFPDKTVLRMDNDTTRGHGAHADILEQFARREADVLVGTQMIAKGHDFPHVTLVGIIDADLSLYFADYRSIERTFQLITQVSGRAGRDEIAGKVILQTYTPRHYVYKYAVNNDYKAFFEKECNLREVTKYPPFSRIVRVLVSGEAEELVSDTLKRIFLDVTLLSKAHPGCFAYLSAMRSPVKRIQNKFRMQILTRIVDKQDEITSAIFDIAELHRNPKILCFVEQNPNNLS